jgi:hypothetical protein
MLWFPLVLAQAREMEISPFLQNLDPHWTAMIYRRALALELKTSFVDS